MQKMSMSIIIPSCRAYSDCWTPFVRLFKKYWPNCKYPLYLMTDRVDEPWLGDGVNMTEVDLGWSQNLYHNLNRVKDPLVLMLLDDFFLTEEVDKEFIDRAVRRMWLYKDVVCTRLAPCPGPDYHCYNDVGVIDSNAPYKVSTQAAIWRKDALQEILTKTDSAWSFETEGTKLKTEGVFLSAYREKHWPLNYLISGINRGKWNPDAISICKKNGVNIDLSRRQVDSK